MAKMTTKKGRTNDGKYAQGRADELVDSLAQFEQFKAEILPALQEELLKGTDAEVLVKKFDSHAVARIISIVMTEKDSGKALAAAKEILDRSQGKAAQKVETTHRFEKLDDNELDALLKSRLTEEESDDDNKGIQ